MRIVLFMLTIIGGCFIALCSVFITWPVLQINGIFVGMLVLLYRNKPWAALMYMFSAMVTLDLFLSHGHGIPLFTWWLMYLLCLAGIHYLDITYQWTKILSIIVLSIVVMVAQWFLTDMLFAFMSMDPWIQWNSLVGYRLMLQGLWSSLTTIALLYVTSFSIFANAPWRK